MDTTVWTPSGTNRSGVYEMLVLSRKTNEKIMIGDKIVLTIVKIDRNQVRLGITAPGHVPVYREEIMPLNLDKLATDVATTQPPATESSTSPLKRRSRPSGHRPAGSN